MANGAIIWEGASELDGAPIMLVATGLKSSTNNSKTGAMIQTWILRSDISPVDATHSGADASICGDCPHRGEIVDGKNVNRSCYVAVFQAPRSIYATAQRGGYVSMDLDAARGMLAGRVVRAGAYGDPAAVPFKVWETLLADSERGTGYTHQWQHCDARFSQFCMASAESLEEAREAQAIGYRTFRVGTPAESMVKGEFLCPASKEAGKKTDCDTCRACSGTDAPNKSSVYIPVHGPTFKTKAHARRYA